MKKIKKWLDFRGALQSVPSLSVVDRNTCQDQCDKNQEHPQEFHSGSSVRFRWSARPDVLVVWLQSCIRDHRRGGAVVVDQDIAWTIVVLGNGSVAGIHQNVIANRNQVAAVIKEDTVEVKTPMDTGTRDIVNVVLGDCRSRLSRKGVDPSSIGH